MIVVTGATGAIGGELVRRLSRAGALVRALTRRPEGQPALAGVEWRGADLEGREDLAAVLQGARKLFLLSANSDGLVRREKNVLAAAADAQLELVVATVFDNLLTVNWAPPAEIPIKTMVSPIV